MATQAPDPRRARGDDAVTLELLEEVAREFYGSDKSQKEVAKIVSGRLHREIKAWTISRWLERARTEGIVTFAFDRNFGITGVESAIEARNMKHAFGLGHCDVVRVVDPGAQTEPLSDSILHVGLANFAGERARASFRPDETVGVGGGRAVHRFATYLARRWPDSLSLKIFPLSGRIWCGSWLLPPDGHSGAGSTKGLLERPLDADDVATVLASAYEGDQTSFSQIGFPLYCESALQARGIKAGHCAAAPGGRWNFGLRAPHWAVLGIGIFDSKTGHRIRIFLDRFPPTRRGSKDAPYLSRAREDLEEALRIAERAELPYFGDLGNRLFPCLPLPDRAFSRSKAARWETALVRIARRLESINRKAIVVDWEHLRQVNRVKVIAGGAAKIPALWTLLLAPSVGAPRPSDRPSLISDLTIDQETAIQLLAHKRTYNESGEWQDWYRRVATKIRLLADPPRKNPRDSRRSSPH